MTALDAQTVSVEVSDGLEVSASLALCVAAKVRMCRKEEYDQVLRYVFGKELTEANRLEAVNICSRHVSTLLGANQEVLQDSLSRALESLTHNCEVMDEYRGKVQKDGVQGGILFQEWVSRQRALLDLKENVQIFPVK